MKKLTIGFTILFVSLRAAFGLPSFDPFTNAVGQYVNGTAYTPGAALYHQTNAFGEGWALWAGADASYSVHCVNSNVSYSGFPASFPAPPLNTAVLVPGSDTTASANTGQHAALNLSRIVSVDPSNQRVNSVYASFLMQIPSIGKLNSGSPTYFGGFSTTTGDQIQTLPNSGLKLFARGNSGTAGSSTSWGLGVANNSGSGSAFWGASNKGTADVLFIVVDYEFGINGNADVSRLWVNPDASTFGTATAPAETGSISITGANRITQAADFYLLARSGGNSWGSLLISDLRLGATWAFVTGAPEFTNAPLNLTNNALTTASFTAAALAGPTNGLGYQWQLNGQGVLNGPNVSGAQTSALTITHAYATNAGTYTLVASNAVGSATASALLVLNPPSFSQQPPASVGVAPGGSTSMSVAASGVATLSYRWYENSSPITDGTSGTGTVFSGAGTATLQLSSVGYGDTGATLYCVVTDGGRVTATSSSATLTVQDPAIGLNPQNVTNNFGGAASFFVTPVGTPSFSFHWFFNGNQLNNGASISGSGAIVSGATSSNLLVTGVTYLDGGSYHVVVSGPGPTGSATSSDATLTVMDPYIVIQPSPLTRQSGTSASFTASAQGTPTLSYQWQKDGTPLSDIGNITGSQTATLNINPLTTNDTGGYAVVVQGGSGANVTSAAAALTVLDPVALASSPLSRVVRVGDHIGFAVGVNGTAPAFQWSRNSTPLPGATASTLELASVQTTNAGTYSVVATNLFGTASASATLSVSTSGFRLWNTNLVVARVGDGAQTLNDVSGNTIYLDQIQTNGAYLNSSMVPDTGPAAIITGGAVTGTNETFLTVSPDQSQLSFIGYAVSLPYGGNLAQDTAAQAPKGIGSVDALGTSSLVFTNVKIYTPGRQARAITTDGNNNYWVVGSVGGLKWMTPNAAANTIPTIYNPNDLRTVRIIAGNLWCSVGSTSGSGNAGVFEFSGLPIATQNPTAIISEGSSGNPNDFALSPDGNTLYVADSNPIGAGGGIQRWDNSGGTWSLNYTLGTGNGSTAGASGLVADFSHFTGGGSVGIGAVVYATTAEDSDNRLIIVNDTAGSGSPAAMLTHAGVNQLFRGVRFGLLPLRPAIAIEPQTNILNYAGSSTRLWVTATGTELSYQWQLDGTNLAGATSSLLVLPNVQSANGGTYACVVSNTVGVTNTSPAFVQILSTPTSPYPHAVLSDGPLAYWRLDEANGAAVANDYVDGHYGWYYNTQLGAPGYNSLDPDTAAGFGASGITNSYVGNVQGIDFSAVDNSEFSVEAWVKGAAQSVNAGIVSLGYVGGQQFSLDTGAAGNNFEFLVRDFATSSLHAAASTNGPDGNWHHLVGVCDETNGIVVLYLDGVSNAVAVITPGTGIILPATPLSIGSHQSSNNGGTYDLGFTGTIDEVALYNYALSPARVLAHYNAGALSTVAITVAFTNGQMVLSWPGSGTLQSAGQVNGQWTNIVPAPTQPYQVSPTGTQQFYRLKIQ